MSIATKSAASQQVSVNGGYTHGEPAVRGAVVAGDAALTEEEASLINRLAVPLNAFDSIGYIHLALQCRQQQNAHQRDHR